jgi:hypothetical protein
VNISKPVRKNFIYGCLVLLGVVTCFCMLWLFLASRSISENKYCNTNNELFRAIKENALHWAELFPPVAGQSVGLSSRLHIDFAVNNRQNFRVYSEYWLTQDGSPIFYVPTHPSWPATTLGRKGLFYTPTGKLPIYGIDQIEELGYGIYCYSVD